MATTSAARSPDAGGVANAAPASVSATPATENLPATGPGGDVEAVVPVASFGPADGAPQVLGTGKTYPIVITVWVAATSGPAVVDVGTNSGRLLGPTHETVGVGVTRLHYSLVVAAGSTDLTIAANAHTHDGGTVARLYTQQVLTARTCSPNRAR